MAIDCLVALATYCWAWNLAFRVICVRSEIPLGEINFPFAHSYRLEMASGLQVGVCVYLPLSVLGTHLA